MEKLAKFPSETAVCDLRWYIHSHSLSAICSTEKQISCNSCLRVIILIIIMVFVKDISLARFSNKWSLFLWLRRW